jgi:radical SAM superfamily enzyme YgiQ (UPF0313 family)
MSSNLFPRRLFRLVVPKYPSFNVYSRVARKTTALGPICVATSVSKMPGWDAEIIDENNYRFPGPLDARGMPDHHALHELRPADVAGFYGGLSCTIGRIHELAELYRSWGALTMGGGSHLDALPEESLRSGLDVVVHGEGEETIREILQAWESRRDFGAVAGVSFLKEGRLHRTPPRAPIEDFESMPLPDFGLLRFAKVSVFPVSRIRGCGANCEFCSVKGAARCASPERLLAQIRYVAEAFRAREFFVVDDQFAQNRSETLRFCRLLRDYQRRMGLRFFITVQIRLELARDEELLDAMRECGVRCLAIGFESVIDEELRAMRKGLRASQMLDLASRYRRHGFLIHAMFIFGYPMPEGVPFAMSAKERIDRFRKFIRQAKLDTIQVLLPAPLPGTALRERLEAQGRVLPLSWEYYDGNFPLIASDEPLTPEQVQKSILEIMGGFYRFRHMFGVGLRTLLFPFAMLPLVNVQARWRRWYRSWRNDIVRFAGWCIIRNWRKRFRKDRFLEKLRRAVAASRRPRGV